jgi:hypothetical protein
MSCLALPVAGLPTRRARFNSASVDSGTSEKSIFRSGICLALAAARLPRADNADCLFAIFPSPQSVDNKQNSPSSGKTQSFGSALLEGMFFIFPVKPFGVREDGSRLFKKHPVLC